MVRVLLSILLCGTLARTPVAMAAGGMARFSIHGKRDNAFAVALQPDGKIVVVGSAYNSANLDAFVMRLMPDGKLDAKFGENGVLVVDLGSDDEFYALEIQKDGKITCVGTSRGGRERQEAGGDFDFLMMRLNADGSRDALFGDQGLLVRGFGFGNDKAYGVVTNDAGEMFVAGTVFVGTDHDQAIAKLRPTGQVDETFGKQGVLLNSFGIDDDYANGILQQPDGKLVLFGNSRLGRKNLTTVARFEANGLIDTRFGQGGKVLTSVRGTQDNSFAGAIQRVSDSRILVTGSTSNGEDLDLALIRYHPDGNLDLSFAVYGKKIVQFGKGTDNSYAMALQKDDRIIVAGSSFEESQFNFDSTLIRYTKQGNIDNSFGKNGKVFARVDPGYDAIYGIAVQPDDKIVTVGVTSREDSFELALMRFLPNGAIDPSFVGPTKPPRSVATQKK